MRGRTVGFQRRMEMLVSFCTRGTRTSYGWLTIRFYAWKKWLWDRTTFLKKVKVTINDEMEVKAVVGGIGHIRPREPSTVQQAAVVTAVVAKTKWNQQAREEDTYAMAWKKFPVLNTGIGCTPTRVPVTEAVVKQENVAMVTFYKKKKLWWQKPLKEKRFRSIAMVATMCSNLKVNRVAFEENMVKDDVE